MTAIEALREARVRIWTATLDVCPARQMLDIASELDELGYGSLWFGEAHGGESLTTSTALVGATRSIVIGTGIANIDALGPMATAAAARTVHALSGGRFVLGLGVSHQPMVERDRNRDYLPPVVLAALGPKMLELARDHTAGAHHYLVTPAHTARTRGILGADPLLVVEQAVVLHQVREEGLRRAHEHLAVSTGLANYRSSWLREGFTEADLVRGGSDRLAKALVTVGDEEATLSRVQEHLDAGADHVCLQVLGSDLFDVPIPEWRTLAAALRQVAL